MSKQNNLSIYLVERQFSKDDYDPYDNTFKKIVVCCETEYEARTTHPYKNVYYDAEKVVWYMLSTNGGHRNDLDGGYNWINAKWIENLKVTKLGNKKGLILASENY